MKDEQKNYKYCQELINLKRETEERFVLMGEYLYHIKNKQLYEPSWSSFEELLMEMKMSSNMANTLIRIFTTLVLGHGFTPQQIATAGSWSDVQEILPYCTSKKESIKWLTKARELTSTDLRRETRETKSGVSMANCQHEHSHKLIICDDCGIRIKYEM